MSSEKQNKRIEPGNFCELYGSIVMVKSIRDSTIELYNIYTKTTSLATIEEYEKNKKTLLLDEADALLDPERFARATKPLWEAFRVCAPHLLVD